MNVYKVVEKDHYIDSLATLYATTVLNEQPGIGMGLVSMATGNFFTTVADMGISPEEVRDCTGADYVVIALAESEEAFRNAVAQLKKQTAETEDVQSEAEYGSIAEAKGAHPGVNLCSIAVPGEYALEEVKKALDEGLHCVVFSNNVPLEHEREMKELAREKGLLCMGPDCGVANINGAALVLASITNSGPFGICGASGCGIQHVASILHDAGSGVSQVLGTGGNDLKEAVGGLMMLMGIDVLEADPKTECIVLVSRKPADAVLQKLLDRISHCKKPRVVYFMGCERETVEQTGAVWAENLDDCAQKALRLVGREYPLEDTAAIQAQAMEAVQGMAPGQKYVRGVYSGGTYMDEAMRAMEGSVGGIWSNAPLAPEWQLMDSLVSFENTCVDYGEEEFTLGRPHPAIDPSIRRPRLQAEAADPETAVILLDFILTPPGHPDPAGHALEDIVPAMARANAAGRKLVFVASVLGTDADFQDVRQQRQKLRDAGVIVCSTNYRAAQLAGEIVRLRREAEDEL